MGLADEGALMNIKNELGGSVKRRSGVRALRYRLHNLKGIIALLNRINGEIRNSVRVVQMKTMCEKYGIEFIPAKAPTRANS